MSRDITACHVTGRCCDVTMTSHAGCSRATDPHSYRSSTRPPRAHWSIDRGDIGVGRARGMPGEQWRPEIVADEWQIEMIIDCSADRREAILARYVRLSTRADCCWWTLPARAHCKTTRPRTSRQPSWQHGRHRVTDDKCSPVDRNAELVNRTEHSWLCSLRRRGRRAA